MSNSLTADIQSRLLQAKEMKNEDRLYRHNGILYSSILSPPENLIALETMEARPDDILLVAYPKSGTNWMVAVVKKIMAAALGEKTEDKPNAPPLLEFFPIPVQKAVAKMPSPRFFGTHFHPDCIPPSFMAKKTKMLVIFRNPKDTAVSYFHFVNNMPSFPSAISWDSFFSDFMTGEVGWGSYFDHALAWEKRMDDPNIMIVTYEDMKQNLSGGVQEIATFFGLEITDEQVNTIAHDCTFNAMKDGNTHGNMAKVFFRKGEVGDWKNHFNEAQSQQMDEEFEKRLAGTKLGAKIKYDVYCKW